jgi:PPOX class probable F420-dependent enzyme
MTDQLTIPETHHDLFESSVVTLSTLNADGSIQSSAVWVLLDDDGLLRISLATTRYKYRNLLARPQATIFAISPSDPFHTAEVRANVEIADDPDHSFLARVAALYGTSVESFDADEQRVIVTFHPTRVRVTG